MAARHRFREEIAAHLPGDRGDNRTGEEEPGVSALAGPGPFDRRRDPDPAAGLSKRRHVLLPRRPIEICRKEKAGLVLKERVDPDHVLALKVIEDDLVGDGKEGPV